MLNAFQNLYYILLFCSVNLHSFQLYNLQLVLCNILAYLVQIDTTNKVFFFYQNSKTGYGNFVTNDSISATLPNSTQNVTLDVTDADSFYGNTADDVANSTAYAPEVKKNSGELIFLENRDPINRSSSQIEDIKLIIEF